MKLLISKVLCRQAQEGGCRGYLHDCISATGPINRHKSSIIFSAYAGVKVMREMNLSSATLASVLSSFA